VDLFFQKVLLNPGMLFSLPLSMLLILSAALASGALAAGWFALRGVRSTTDSAEIPLEINVVARIVIAESIAQTDAPSELAEKLG
jgi:hypothetical protein